MMKNVLVIFCSLLFLSIATAQKKNISISAGPTYAIPINEESFKYYFKNGIGAHVAINYGISKLGTLSGVLRYLSFEHKIQGGRNITPLFLGLGYKTGFVNSGFFVSGGGGKVFEKTKTVGKYFLGTSIGYTFKITENSTIQIFPNYTLFLGSGGLKMTSTFNLSYGIYLKKI